MVGRRKPRPSTRATGCELPVWAQMLGKAYPGALPLSGRLKISQSRSCPRPPRLMLPRRRLPAGMRSKRDWGRETSGVRDRASR